MQVKKQIKTEGIEGVTMKKQTKDKKMRKAISMVEVILVIIIGAFIAAMIIPKLISNSSMNTFLSEIHSDTQSIITAANKWRKSSPNSDGTWNNLTTDAICPYLPTTMKCENGIIYSSQYKGLVHFKVAPYKVNNNGDSIKIFVDVTGSVLNSASLRKKAETQAMDSIAGFSSDPTTIVEDGVATDIGNPNAGFTDGGTADDGKFGVAGIMQ